MSGLDKTDMSRLPQILCISLLMSLNLPTPAAPAAPELHMLRVRSDRPDWPALADEDIRTLVSGATMTPLGGEESVPGAATLQTIDGDCPDTQAFSSDGRWRRRCGTGWIGGRWSVRNSQLCVVPDGIAEQCKPIWQGSKPDMVIMQYSSDSWNAYKVSPIPAGSYYFDPPPLFTIDPAELEQTPPNEAEQGSKPA